jgi:hypothetical protein
MRSSDADLIKDALVAKRDRRIGGARESRLSESR